jgi:hypothetical protein
MLYCEYHEVSECGWIAEHIVCKCIGVVFVLESAWSVIIASVLNES